ncbi:MAG TPA: restriction endonuclease, SacI family, partial [Chthonomonadales bacterium]|nr:restriction endonuclease, SacI family [Chthonomonadales bacterium]
MPTLDYDEAADLLSQLFKISEQLYSEEKVPEVAAEVVDATDKLFASTTQSYREVLLGCGLARILDRSINIRRPYVNQGEDSFNARTLDERVVNPFFQERHIPSSKGPYLASFRRNVQFVPVTAAGLRDKKGYQALLTYLGCLETASEAQARDLVVYLLCRFIALREGAVIPLSKIGRMSLDQYCLLVDLLLAVKSGGLLPVLLTVAMLRTIKACFGLFWIVEWQGINVSDKASGAGGDITVTQDGSVLLALEVTERPIGSARVVSTFNTKIVRAGIEDYLFVYSAAVPEPGA